MKILSDILAQDAIHDVLGDTGGQCRALVSSFAAGLRIPDVGMSSHAEFEISLVLSGAFELESGGVRAGLKAGDLVIVPPGEAHFFDVVADTRIFTVTVTGFERSDNLPGS